MGVNARAIKRGKDEKNRFGPMGQELEEESGPMKQCLGRRNLFTSPGGDPEDMGEEGKMAKPWQRNMAGQAALALLWVAVACSGADAYMMCTKDSDCAYQVLFDMKFVPCCPVTS